LQFSFCPGNGLKKMKKDKKSSILPNQFFIGLKNQAKMLSRGNVASGKTCNGLGIEFHMWL
jgi:hypothetical protein